jgi:glutamyl-Q tRNA(Asp) synthetase
MQQTMIVTRFAPSPTGFLHLGHAYAALVAFDTAKQAGGRFLLRIEDIDAGRCRSEFEQAAFDDLHWLGVAWQKPVRRQSQHFADYAKALHRLQEKGVIYPCFCTRKEIEAEVARAVSAPHPEDSSAAIYPGTCRGLSPQQREQRIAGGQSYALRLDCTKALMLIAHDELRFDERGHGPNGETGVQRARPELLGDVVIARKDFPASYHLAVVVDDALQGVTLVTRGEDLFSATHVQRLLQALLSVPTPAYAHHRLLLDARGRKFSKRDNAVTLRSLRASGATPDDIRLRIGM